MTTNRLASFRRPALLALSLAAAFLATSAGRTVQAGEWDRYGSVVIVNNLGVSMPFQLRLGDRGPWTDYRVSAHAEKAIIFELEYGRAPTPNIRFDSIAGSGYRVKSYGLDFYEVYNEQWHRGKPYKFKFESDNVHLDLYTAD